jgi:hypothetical protein
MATFKPTVRTKSEFNAVYIRISANSKTDYIKTSMIIHKSCIDSKEEIIDYEVLGNCYIQIKEYYEE